MPSLGAVYIRDVSGHAALIDSSGNLQVNIAAGASITSSISGQPVNVTSGLVAVTSGVWLASGIVVNISGQNVTATTNVVTNVSGQQVYLGSGSNIVALSGASVSVSGNAIASGLWLASGNMIAGSVTVTSGEIHIASGIVTVGSGISLTASGLSVSTSISGNAISAISGAVSIMSGVVSVSGLFQAGLAIGGSGGISGAIPTALLGFDYSGAKWNPIGISTSGGNILNVAANVTSTALQSGEIHVISGFVTIGSGANLVMSGLAIASGVFIASGINMIGTDTVVSGEIHVISGFVTVGSGGQTIGIVTIGAQPITVQNSGQTITAASGVILASGIIPNISGQAVSVSGDSVVPVLGAPPMTSGFGFSGGLVTTASMYDFSGQKWVPMSSVTSGQNSALEVAQAPATQIRIGLSGTAVQSGLPNTSGGTALQSGDLYVITVRNVSGNNDMYVGGSGARPFSGFGFVLCGGDALTMSITNSNLVYVFATTSGQFVKWIGSQF